MRKQKSGKNGETQSKPNGQSLRQFKEDELWKALMDVEDLFGRLLTPFFLLGETAHQVVSSEPLSGPNILVGVKRKQMTPECLSTIRTTIGVEPQDNGFTYYVSEVPVHVKFIRCRYKFLETLDFKSYRVGEFNIPNPFQDYWDIRSFVR